MNLRQISGVWILFALTVWAVSAQQPTGPQLVREGRLDEALAVFRAAVATSPKSLAANNGVGVVLDLLGRYTEATQYLAQAIKAAPKPLDHALAQRAMAVSYGFTADCKNAEKFESGAFDFYLNTSDFYNAGEVADELGRLCLDAGDLNRAAEWYRKGYNTGLDEPNISLARKDLWDFRLAHAEARMAARRGKFDDAHKYVKQARAILDKGRNPEQEQYYPYLAGYVSFYEGNYSEALEELQSADLADPFIQCMIGQTYEGLGNREQSLENYRRAANSTAHSVPAAYARPFAQRKLTAGMVSR